jgi:hypothetical protein
MADEIRRCKTDGDGAGAYDKGHEYDPNVTRESEQGDLGTGVRYEQDAGLVA